MIFYLGTNEPAWLPRTDVPLFLSRRRLARRRALPRARGLWALDSGGFTELSLHGAWQTMPTQYVGEVRRWRDEIGGLAWASIQDWMCEPWIVEKTGKSVAQHQSLTLDSFARLLDLAPDLPWVPVIQGWHEDEYRAHVDAYVARRLPLWDRPVGVGSICRRQTLGGGARIVRQLSRLGLQLHGFGLKFSGLAALHGLLASADSLAWSFRARNAGRQPGCTHATCQNCLRFALRWRDRVRATYWNPAQTDLFTPTP